MGNLILTISFLFWSVTFVVCIKVMNRSTRAYEVYRTEVLEAKQATIDGYHELTIQVIEQNNILKEAMQLDAKSANEDDE